MNISQLQPSNTECLHQLYCEHCSGVVEDSITNTDGEIFCCKGCECIHHILKGRGLDLYYEMAKSENKDIPQSFDLYEYYYLKDQSYLDEYQADNYYTFFVEGIECLACSWLFDNLSSISSLILDAQYSHQSHCFKVKVKDVESLFEAMTPIIQLGYKLSPVRDSTHLSMLNRKKDRSDLIRIAVSMILMGNISLLSFSDYFGLRGEFLEYFRFLSSLLFLIIPTYCSWPFFSSSMKMLKSWRVSLDLPISASILIGTGLSYYNYFQESGYLYFDSIATFVFLILGVRYVLNKVYAKAYEKRNVDELLGARQVEVIIDGGCCVKRHSSLLKNGDIVRIEAGKVVPLTGIIADGASFFNESLLTGESEPISKKVGDTVIRGSYNYSEDVLVEVSIVDDDELVQESLKEFEMKELVFTNFSNLTQRYSLVLFIVYFLAGVILFSCLEFSEAVERFLALSIIGCPCALGIGIPLSCILANQALIKNGILIKDSNFFEKLRKVEHIFIDKTGTITSGHFSVEVLSGKNKYIPIVLGIEIKSTHPIAKSIVRSFDSVNPVKIEEFHEIIGVGAKGCYNGVEYIVRSNNNAGEVVLVENNQVVLTLGLSEQVHDNELRYLREMGDGHQVTILSGDKQAKVDEIISHIGIERVSALAELTPKMKKEEISSQYSLYIGDGLNDIPAMTKSNISISFNASDLVNLACQCVFLKPSLKLVSQLFKMTKQVESIVLGNILFSIIYNIIGIGLACSGYITPLFAVVFMPMSSLIIIAMTFYRTRSL